MSRKCSITSSALSPTTNKANIPQWVEKRVERFVPPFSDRIVVVDSSLFVFLVCRDGQSVTAFVLRVPGMAFDPVDLVFVFGELL